MSEAYELIIITYVDTKLAAETIQTLQKNYNDEKVEVITAAAISKDVNGETEIVATIDIARKKGTHRGALAGGLLTLIAPPIGLAGIAVGAAAGGLIGRKASVKNKKNFTADLLQGILDQMTGGSSALIILADEENAERIARDEQAQAGEIVRQPLTEEMVTALLSQGELSEKAPGLSEEEVALLKSRIHAGTQRKEPKFERVFVIVNPASGQDETILNTLNSVFRATGLDWDLAITKQAGDATRLAKEASQADYDIVAAYGGDGTVMEAATGLVGSDVPLAILPGGTNNVLSVELGVPKGLPEAAALIGATPAAIRSVDMGRANAHAFILRVGIGYEAVINETADREMKDRLGGFAYTLAGLKALKDPPIATYRLVIDGRVEELEGLWCMIANSASLGAPNLNLVQEVSVSDGLLDVIIVRQADLDSLLSVVSSVTGQEKLGKPLPHWQARKVLVEATPEQAITGDGEIWESTPLDCEVIPDAVGILVPA